MSERNLMIAMAAVAILACIPQIPFAYWPLVLVVIGLVYGGMHAEDDLLTRLGYIVIAAALPLVADNLDSISFGAFLANFTTPLTPILACSFILLTF